ncbi:MAG: hypothetical protein AAB421_03045 [Patescibacteria group bacterium]
MIFDIAIILAVYGGIVCVTEILGRHGVLILLTRKYAHALSGVAAALLPFAVEKNSALACGIVGAIILGFLVLKGYLPAIGSHGVFDVGVVMFPLGLSLCAFLFWSDTNFLAYQYAALMLGLPDAVAGIVGTRYGGNFFKRYSTKSFEGSAAFFATAFFLSIFFLTTGVGISLGIAVAYAALAGLILAVIEGVSRWGTDNLTVPLAAGTLVFSLLKTFVTVVL